MSTATEIALMDSRSLQHFKNIVIVSRGSIGNFVLNKIEKKLTTQISGNENVLMIPIKYLKDV